jgi:tryptophan-rich sensory protein
MALTGTARKIVLILIPPILAMLFALTAIGQMQWYEAIPKPIDFLPVWAMVIIWVIFYFMAGYAYYLIDQCNVPPNLANISAQSRKTAIGVFYLSLITGLIWIPVIFIAHDLLAAYTILFWNFLMNIIVVWLFWGLNGTAGGLMLGVLLLGLFGLIEQFLLWMKMVEQASRTLYARFIQPTKRFLTRQNRALRQW